MMWLLVFLLGSGMEVVSTFQSIPEDGGDYLSAPASFIFAPDGRLYLVDSNTSRVHIWNPDGTFLSSFGRKGEGPGEFNIPMVIDIGAGSLWVLDGRGVLSQHDMQGNFIKSSRMVKPRLRTFSALEANRFLITARYQESPTVIHNHIELVDAGGELLATMKKWRNESFTAPREGNNYAKVKAFPPACEVQRGADGLWYFGFSQNKKLFQVNAAGKIVTEVNYDLPAEKVTDEEKAWWPDLAIPCLGGGTFAFKNFPNIRTDFDHPKAYYTRFVVKREHVIFLQTPDGGVFSCEGFPEGNWFACDRETGALLNRGRFQYGDGSLVFTRNDRILGLILNEEEEFEISELDFPTKP